MKGATAFASLILLAACCALAAEEQAELVVNGENAFGQVWVNLSLTGLRLNEAYVPMVIAVYNRSKGEATLTRDSFRLIGSDGRDVHVPGVKDLRRAYGKMTMDRRMLSTAGIPVNTWSHRSRTVPSNFFPAMGSAAGGTTIDHVSMPPLYGMVDLIYFERPRGLALGQAVILEVQPKGWEEPIRLRIRITP